MDKIYIIGHKSPDLDSIASPIAYAKLKNILEKTDGYAAARSGEIGPETKYVLEKFGFSEPELVGNVAGKNLILVDHNEASQSPVGVAEKFSWFRLAPLSLIVGRTKKCQNAHIAKNRVKTKVYV